MTLAPQHRGVAAAPTMEQRAALLLQLRRCGVRDVNVMRAIETVPRELFTPHRFKDLGGRNIALPIACGQTMPAPADLARALQALSASGEHRAYEVGAGSGYGSAVLARIVRKLVSVERFETLARDAGRRLAALSIANAVVVHGDGLRPERSLGLFERILLHVAVEAPPPAVLELLAPDGIMVFTRLQAPAASGTTAASRLIKLVRRPNGDLVEADLGPFRQTRAAPGAAQAL